jgi:anti-sigma regulatory factor (Ser/Thr protein kinase)
VNHAFAHSAAVYEDNAQLLDVAVPFLREGVDRGQPTLLGVGSSVRPLLLDALDDAGRGVTQLPAWPPAGAFSTLHNNRQLITDHADRGTREVRLLGEVPYRDVSAPWGGWIRYEAAINALYADLGVSMLCLYDRRVAPPQILDDVTLAHPLLAADGDGSGNPRFVPPATLLANLARRDVDPIETQRPALELVDQLSSVSRHAVAALAATTSLDESSIESLVLALGEVVTNALTSGRPPVVVRAWVADDRIVVTVQDSGTGPSDPFVGMLPTANAPAGGLGLHIAYQSCTLVTMTRGPSDFTVHLTMRSAPPTTQG